LSSRFLLPKSGALWSTKISFKPSWYLYKLFNHWREGAGTNFHTNTNQFRQPQRNGSNFLFLNTPKHYNINRSVTPSTTNPCNSFESQPSNTIVHEFVTLTQTIQIRKNQKGEEEVQKTDKEEAEAEPFPSHTSFIRTGSKKEEVKSFDSILFFRSRSLC